MPDPKPSRPQRRRPGAPPARRPRPGQPEATLAGVATVTPEPADTPSPVAPEARDDEPATVPSSRIEETAARPESPPSFYERWWATGLPNVWAIAHRELTAIFVSPIFYVVSAALALIVTAISFLPNLAREQAFTLGPLFALVETLMVFVAPLIAMRLLAEERRAGTLEILLTSPVRDWEVVVGKWLGGFISYLAAVAFTVVYVVLISVFQPLKTESSLVGLHLTLPYVDYGAIVAGYIGLMLVGAAWIAIGVLASSITSNQIVAAVVGIGILLLLYVALAFLPLPDPWGSFFDYINASSHAQSFHSGQVVLRDVVFFLSLTVGALFGAARVLESRRWR
jgi:ABC-2 type transport system permease protein